jgi:UDP-N-acetylglucosamine:LPS N-acetylglucosamine transferase
VSPALPRVALLRSMWLRLQRRMQQQLKRLRPDVVVATQMVPSALVSAVKTDRGWTLPSIGVLTDFGFHDFWIQRGTDLYCVPDPRGHRSGSRAHGRESRRDGRALDAGFANASSQAHSRGRSRSIRSIRSCRAGRWARHGVASVTRRLLDRMPSLQALVVTGHNAEAHDTLTQVAGTYGRGSWCADGPATCRRMSAANIVVGKPGGLTVAESLASGLPLLATRCCADRKVST